MSEDDLLRAVLEACGWLGLHTMHPRPGLNRRGHWSTPLQGDGQGWPDLVLVGHTPGATLFRELKTDAGRLSPAQRTWLRWLTAAGHDAAVWRPTDWLAGTVMTELHTLAAHQPTGPNHS